MKKRNMHGVLQNVHLPVSQSLTSASNNHHFITSPDHICGITVFMNALNYTRRKMLKIWRTADAQWAMPLFLPCKQDAGAVLETE